MRLVAATLILSHILAYILGRMTSHAKDEQKEIDQLHFYDRR